MPKCLKNKYHYLKILFKHIEIGNQEIEFANKVLFIDIDLLITLYYFGIIEHLKLCHRLYQN